MRLIFPALLVLAAFPQADEKTKKEYKERLDKIHSTLASSCYGNGSWLESKRVA